MTQRLLIKLKRTEHAAVRLVCFPYAGGHSAFTQSWARELPADVELVGVNYPRHAPDHDHGRPSAQSIASAVLEELLEQDVQPLILFGYSLGALIAYEVCLLLACSTPRQPAELVVAACRAPTVPSKSRPTAGLSDEQFIARLRELGGTPQQVLESPELLQFFLPMLRVDFGVAESYRPSTVTRLNCPLTAIAGSADETTAMASVAAWEGFCEAGFRWHLVDGGHFFLHHQPQALLAIVRSVVDRHRASPFPGSLAPRPDS